MGQVAMRRPKWVCSCAIEMLEYLAGSSDRCLVYTECRDLDWGESVELPFRRDMKRLEMYADASFSPGGGRSCHGIMAFYGGGLVQWEASRQSFAALSTTECEVMGYMEAMVMGDSVSAVLDCLEGGPWLQGDAEKILYGDSLSGVALLTNPDGPWRTRHLRLRAFALRERVRDGSWKLRHVKGDFLTKAITVRAAWQKFTSFVGMIDVAVKAVEPEGSEVKRLTKLLGVGLALGLTACLPSSVGRTVGLASLAVGLAKLYSDAVPQVDRANDHPRVKALKSDQEPIGQRAQGANQEPIGQRAQDADQEPAGRRARDAKQERVANL